MNFETGKFYRVVYSLAILWCCMIRANGDTDRDIVLNSNIFKILSGIQNETGVNPLISVFYVNIGNGPFNLNIPLNVSGSNTNATAHEKPIKTVTTLIKTVPEDYILTEGIGYYKLHKSKLNWDDAREVCKAENANLAVYYSEKEEEMLRQLLRNDGNTDEAYIGIYYNGNTGWSYVPELSPKNSRLALPVDWWDIKSETSKCVVVTLDSKDYRNCSDEHYYICEIPL